MKKDNATNGDVHWSKSPITGKDQVMVEYDGKNGETKIDMSSGFYTSEHPLNYKKTPNFDMEEFEKSMPELMRQLRFDDGESYWYPSPIRTATDMVFPVGTVDEWMWCHAKIVTLEESQGSYDSKLDIDNANYYEHYVDALKSIKGYSLGELS